MTETLVNGERGIYTYSGLRLSWPMRGLNIIEGKKVLVESVHHGLYEDYVTKSQSL